VGEGRGEVVAMRQKEWYFHSGRPHDYTILRVLRMEVYEKAVRPETYSPGNISECLEGS